MTTSTPHVLLLAGTQEARLLAKQIPERHPNLRLTVSFAGAVKDLPDLGVPTRIGGFGGVEGLTDYLATERVTVLLDATHPFAIQMSQHAQAAAQRTGTPLLRMDRPPWQPGPEDRWITVENLQEAARLIPSGARAFLAIGRNEIDRFRSRTDIFALVRMIEPPANRLPEDWALVLARPPQDEDAECRLLQQHHITHVVTKNSGGTRSAAKLAAARHLGLDVIMVARPDLAAVRSAPTISELLMELETALNRH